MADEKQEVQEKVSTSSEGQKSPFIVILLVLNIIVMGAVAYLQFSSASRMASQASVRDVIKADMQVADGEAVEENKDTNKSIGLLLPLASFTANLAQGDGPRRFIRLNTVLRFSGDSNEGEFKTRKPQIRDSIISILNSKRPSDLLKKEGKEYLKEEIKASINSFLIDGRVVDVYYVSFQIN